MSVKTYHGFDREITIGVTCLADALFSKGWVIHEFLGAGANSEVFVLCYGQQCTRVVKIIPLSKISESIFYQEVNALHESNPMGLSPIVYDSWI